MNRDGSDWLGEVIRDEPWTILGSGNIGRTPSRVPPSTFVQRQSNSSAFLTTLFLGDIR